MPARNQELQIILLELQEQLMASQQTLTDLENAVNANTAAVAAVIAELNAANNDDSAIEAQVTALNAATEQLTSATSTTPPSTTSTS